MKNLVYVVVFLAVICFWVTACGKIKTYTEPQLEISQGGPDNSTYPFETPSDSTIFTKDGAQITDENVSTDRSYMGNSSLKLTCIYAAGNSQGALRITGSGLQMAGKVLTAHVWVPAHMFADPNNAYGSFFYVKLANYRWYQNQWQNLNMPQGNALGVWNTVSAIVDQMLYNGSGNTLKADAQDANTTVEWGLIVAQGGSSSNYSGYIYVDSLNVQ
jgi:hypothetical protein